ncbi:MAG: helix-turn-helix domain-containing protein [Clostridia bacterium]|nr:helix-turn-helix domain-containing protein [Clostridia bacterium]
MNKLGKALKYQRKINKLSQRELGKYVGVSANVVSRWEVGDNLPSIYILIALADYYEISLDELVDRDFYGRL